MRTPHCFSARRGPVPLGSSLRRFHGDKLLKTMNRCQMKTQPHSEMTQLILTCSHLKRDRRKGDPCKVQLAERLRKETNMTLKWIAEQLHMGTRGHLAHLLYWDGRPAKMTLEI